MYNCMATNASPSVSPTIDVVQLISSEAMCIQAGHSLSSICHTIFSHLPITPAAHVAHDTTSSGGVAICYVLPVLWMTS